MKKNTKKAILIIMMLTTFVLGVCSNAIGSADQLNPIKIWLQNKNGSYETFLAVDETTGVNYIVVSKNGPNSAPSITPRLNADGTLFITK